MASRQTKGCLIIIVTFFDMQNYFASTWTDTLFQWVEKTFSIVEEDIQRDLSEFGRSSSELLCDDDCSIDSEVANLHSFQESIRSELQRLDGLSKGKGLSEAKRAMEQMLAERDALRSLPSMESASSGDMTEESTWENSEEIVPSETCSASSEIPSLEATLSTLLAQYRGLGKTSLALACDFLSADFLDSSSSPILLPWMRHQLDLSFPPSISDNEWLFHVPLLGNIARGDNAELFPCSMSEGDDEVHEGEIEEIDEDGFEDESM